jgi:sporulation protein YlmC with PRC-barrel domain
MTSEEVITPGADVIGTDGDKVGTVAYVVVDPDSLHIADFVVSTGAILGRDIVVSTDQVSRIEDDKVYLTLDKAGLDACKDYVDVEYQAPPADWNPSAGFAYPTGTMLWPAAGPASYYPQASSVTVNTPPGTVGLHEGMEVTSSDGEKVGSIDSLEADPTTESITQLVIKQGFIFTHDVGIPASHVRSVEADRVQLDLTKDEIQQQFGQNE